MRMESRPRKRRVASHAFALGAFAVGCASVPSRTLVPVDEPTHEIDPAIYWDLDDPTDPYGDQYRKFRARRDRDMADPSSPEPLERYAARHVTNAMPWGDLELLLPFDWAALRVAAPERAESLEASVRLRRGFDHPDLEINQLMLGPGAVLPLHADGAPGAYVVIGGRGHVRVGGEASWVTTGSTVKLEPWAARRVEADTEEPLRIVWIRWAPGGDPRYIDAGYYLTGANQHRQPAQANFEEGYLFWGPVDEAYGPVEAADALPEAFDAAVRSARAAWARARARDETPLYPDVPVFGHESLVPWLSAETLKAGGFFFSDDLGSLLEVADKMISIARHKAIFRASRPDGRWDFNFSESAWGPRSTYVEHSHVIPEFYYVLSGPVNYGVDGDVHRSQPGDILFNNSYSPHLAQGVVDGLVFRSFSSTFAPNGDRSVFERGAILLESLPEQPEGAALRDDVQFH